MPPKKAILSVINDLVTDQRVDRTARVLEEMGYEVMLVGRVKRDSRRMPERSYTTERMRLLWEKGPMFYAEFNIRLFFFLLVRKTNLLVSNDLDTLLPNFMVHKIFRAPLLFDSHEYFTETPEVIHRPFVKNFWKRIEKAIVPKLQYCLTVNESIAGLFRQEYGIDFKVVRNIPERRERKGGPTRDELGLPAGKRIILLQGAGINIQRGAEEAVEAMHHLNDVILVIIGGGDVLPILEQMVTSQGLAGKVFFIPKQTPEKLAGYTALADLGLTLDKDTNINYRFSLPNKLFDYIHAGVPVLASPLPEIRKIIDTYGVGAYIENHDPVHIADKIRAILDDKDLLDRWKKNLKVATEELNWEKEKHSLISMIESIETKKAPK